MGSILRGFNPTVTDKNNTLNSYLNFKIFLGIKKVENEFNDLMTYFLLYRAL